jgi:hypothetical protein
MSRQESFDDFESSDYANDAVERKPFQFREDKSIGGTLEWLVGNFDQSEQMSHSRLRSYVRWSFLYKGIQWRNVGRSSYRDENGANQTSKKPKMVDNYIWEFLDHKVGQMSRLGTNITCIPWNDEQADINNAKSCEKLLQARFIDLGFDKLQDDADLIKYKYGTVFQLPLWDADIGPMHKSYEELNKIYKGNIPKHILKQLKKQEAFRIGDVDITNACPWQIQPELYKKSWKSVDHFDYVPDWLHIDEVKAIYPKKAAEIHQNVKPFMDFEENLISYPENIIQVKHFYHRKTKYLPEGAHIIYTDDVILEWKSLEYNHGELPLVVDRDIEIEKELFGRPKISNIEQKQKQTNNIESSVARDLGAGSAPKWLFPKGAVTFKSANNDFSIMEYKGAREPKLVANNPVSQHALAQLDRNESRMAKLMKVYDISRGIIPQGVEANSALRFLDEQEDQANESDKKKRKARVLLSARQTMSIMGQYYDASDDRTSRILGKNNEYMIENLKDADFMKVYDVTIQNTSALPDTKTGKIATIIDMNMATQTDPVFKTDQIIKMLDLGMDEAFVDRATASTNTANSLFEKLTSGQPIEEPQMHDDLMIYYTVFWGRIQDYGFKKRIKGEIRQAVYDYIEILEGLLWTKAQINQKLMMDLMQLDYFPSFFMPNQPAVPQEPMAQPQPSKTGGVDASKMENTQNAIKENLGE